MMLIMLGCCLVGGGLKGAVDSARYKRKRPIISGSAPVRS